jgi:hypothetical protein
MAPVQGGSPPYEYRTSIESLPVTLRQALWLLSFPSAQVLYRITPDEPYTKEMVLFPFGTAFQWFGYGCLFGWWRMRRDLRKANKL